jgi:ubiquinone/menaquinone biosynthesis C-methylase UbiE
VEHAGSARGVSNAAADQARARNRHLFDGLFGRVYSFYTERERLSRLIAAVVWGSDIRPFYANMRAIANVADGGAVVDAPCGAGVAFRGLRPSQQVRYLALDISPAMLERARWRAHDLGLTQIEFVEGDAQSIPVEDAGTDLFLSYFGLHCLPDPQAAVDEMARCLRPGGRVVGAAITSGDSPRHRLLVRPGRGGFGPMGTFDDIMRWLNESGLDGAEVFNSGLFAYFQATKPTEGQISPAPPVQLARWAVPRPLQ